MGQVTGLSGLARGSWIELAGGAPEPHASSSAPAPDSARADAPTPLMKSLRLTDPLGTPRSRGWRILHHLSLRRRARPDPYLERLFRKACSTVAPIAQP